MLLQEGGSLAKPRQGALESMRGKGVLRVGGKSSRVRERDSRGEGTLC